VTALDFTESLRRLYGTPLPAIVVDELAGDASTRRYFRITAHDATTGPKRVIAMKLPKNAFSSDEGGAQPPTERLPFLEVGDLLRSVGVPVPRVFVEHLEEGVVLLEDLGDETFERRLCRASKSTWEAHYAVAVDLLAKMHDRLDPVPAGSIVARRTFDRELLTWELDHFRQWGLEALFGALVPDDAALLGDRFSAVVDAIADMPTGFVHRDYQSRNLMVRDEGPLVVIDFQDAMIGPRVYDLVALLCDSYVPLERELQDAMVARYAALRRIDPKELEREFWTVALHRKLKDAGRFVFIDRVRSNASFLQWYPQSLVYVGRALDALADQPQLTDLLCRVIPGFPDAVSKPASVVE